jgi:hypothetical protein
MPIEVHICTASCPKARPDGRPHSIPDNAIELTPAPPRPAIRPLPRRLADPPLNLASELEALRVADERRALYLSRQSSILRLAREKGATLSAEMLLLTEAGLSDIVYNYAWTEV